MGRLESRASAHEHKGRNGEWWISSSVYETFCLVSSFLQKMCRETVPSASAAMHDSGRRILGIEFADILNIPWKRRMQTIAILQWLFTYLYLGLACLAVCFFLLFTPFFFLPLAYAAFYVYDRHTPERGGRRSEWVRSWRIWTYFKDYFPVTLHRTSPLDPSKNYLFIYHPHGILATGAFINFCTNATGFRDLFPGIRPTMLSLNYQFIFPFNRDYAMALGVCPCSRQSIEWLLTREGKGNAVVLVVGGASEALEARPGSLTLTIKSRKGFARLALQNGTPLVPVFSFGENELFNQIANPQGSLLRRFQAFMTKVLSFSPPAFYGRGVFNYTIGFMPFRRPLDVVVGSPMNVEQVSNPTEEQVDDVHNRYIDNLTSLFEAHKASYGILPDQHLNII